MGLKEVGLSGGGEESSWEEGKAEGRGGGGGVLSVRRVSRIE